MGFDPQPNLSHFFFASTVLPRNQHFLCSTMGDDWKTKVFSEPEFYERPFAPLRRSSAMAAGSTGSHTAAEGPRCAKEERDHTGDGKGEERLRWLKSQEASRARGVGAVRVRQVLVATEQMADEAHRAVLVAEKGPRRGWVRRRVLRDPEAFVHLAGLGYAAEASEWEVEDRLEDHFLDEQLPRSVRQQALQAQPGDVLKLESSKGWHIIRIEDVMLDLRVKRLERSRSQSSLALDLGSAKDAGTYTVVTMGCQMNQADSERMEGQLQSVGLRPVLEEQQPDVVVLNTCSIRDKAEKKVYARLDPHLQRKRKGDDVTIVVSGCVAQQEGEELLRALPEVDVVMGPQFANRLGDVLNESMQGGQICVTEESRSMEDLTVPNRQDYEMNRAMNAAAIVCLGFVKAQTGPGGPSEREDMVVPFTRGSEQSRPIGSIRREVSDLLRQGYREVTLLGQNIDAYGRDFTPRRTFAELLWSLEDLGIERIRFLTSHPRYISDDLITAVRDIPAVCEQFHIPFQSGDDEILRRMERGYTAERYRRIVERIHQEIPSAGLSADAIVGFPGETEEQFQRTLQLVEELPFLTVNLAAYSPRPNTPAALLKDQVPQEWSCRQQFGGKELQLAKKAAQEAEI
ncbi:tRNA-2-methylthio-N(6)-dimethylallyladenosine synthase ((Dimethylallyl)adenosine tRNA methylthiotransferase MiaB) (tRNA-i(6)A37 methylthiotransferase) [Durusdinium trenchii]|uniref:tRNA-2-methylthio-N(6)-dimethylallyladenosine synthase ((Dimethylallyl)adenosine tRNA methylthiotransferase MiaB) (tRNA-i(6)A37 methylthiotransferase) n=1 Tax=Durusdinium trenchii TaxID=1381693 RepID=A0ABP0I8Y3_9DINO